MNCVADEKQMRNARVQQRYDELACAGKHGHYETLFQVVREEVERVKSVGAKPGDIVFCEDPLFEKHTFYEIDAVLYGAEGQESVVKMRPLSRRPASLVNNEDLRFMFVPEPLIRGRIFTQVSR